MAVSAPTPLQAAELYWDTAAETYEEKFSGTIVGKIRRDAVWRDLDRLFRPGQHVLELSCGTGIDAVHLARRGVRVLGCDISPRMIQLARQHAAHEAPSTSPDFRVLATEHLALLESEPRFDGAFSNFSGLNCVEDLPQVAATLGRLLKPGAPLLLCMMGRFLPFDMLWFLAHGKPRRAFERLREPRSHYITTTGLIIRRPTARQIQQQMQPAFRLIGWKGIGIVVPPSYAEPLAQRFPTAIQRLAKLDRRLSPLPLFRNAADCVLLQFERVAAGASRA